jgi:hypothetical protein
MKRFLSAIMIAAALFVSIAATSSNSGSAGYSCKVPELNQCPQPMDGGDYV